MITQNTVQKSSWITEFVHDTLSMLSAICGSARSMDRAAQSMDLRDPWIALRNLLIHTSRRNPWICEVTDPLTRATDNRPIIIYKHTFDWFEPYFSKDVNE